MTIKKIAAVALILSSVACSSASFRKPTSTDLTVPVPRDALKAVQDYRALLASDALTPGTCAPILNDIYGSLAPVAHEDFDWTKLKTDAPEVLRGLWLARLELRSKFLSWVQARGLRVVDTECVNAVRRAFLASRAIEEYVGEWSLQPPPSDPKHLPQPFAAGFPYTLLAPGVDQVEFRSGDVLMSRGTAVTSSAIARVGDVDDVFSHLAILYIDPKTGKKFTIEAHIEVGVVVLPFEQYFQDGKMRAVLFRHSDAALAHQAAKIMYDRASAATAAGANIPYDFAFNPDDDSEIFCAEVIREGFRKASGGKILIPSYPSQISAKNRDFLNDIGMNVTSTFAPMDSEVEPQFQMIAEWRDLSRTHDSQLWDSVLVKIFEWMETHDYILVKEPINQLQSNVLWQMRQIPIFDPLLKTRFPTNMAVKTLEAVFALTSAGDALKAELIKRDNAYRKRTGFWMSPAQMRAALEDFRTQDLAVWTRWSEWTDRHHFDTGKDRRGMIDPPRAKFHPYFHAR